MSDQAQHFSATDPETVKGARKFLNDAREARRRAVAWADERGGVARGNLYGVTGLAAPPEGFGKWTKTYPSRPHKSNREEWKLYASLAFPEPGVPGLPMTFLVGDHAPSPALVVHQDAAYVGWSEPVPASEMGEQWHECPGSTYHLAWEAAQ